MTWTIKRESPYNYCQHCRRAIGRKGTYLIVNEKGERKQVGRTCLKFFIPSMPRGKRLQARAIEQEKAMQSKADKKHTQQMIANPGYTLIHAQAHLYKTFCEEGGDKQVYIEAIRTLGNSQRLL
jgi:hypothetical protein